MIPAAFVVTYADDSYLSIDPHIANRWKAVGYNASQRGNGRSLVLTPKDVCGHVPFDMRLDFRAYLDVLRRPQPPQDLYDLIRAWTSRAFTFDLVSRADDVRRHAEAAVLAQATLDHLDSLGDELHSEVA